MRDTESFESLDGDSPSPPWRDGGWAITGFVAGFATGAVVGAIAALLAAARLGRTQVRV